MLNLHINYQLQIQHRRVPRQPSASESEAARG
nr:MAG TPA: hypothetical protein [Caudoviricetes sp.]